MGSYSFHATMQGNFDDVVDRVTTALAAEGFGVLTEIDVQATMKAKLDVDVSPYRILGACNPPLAHRALTAEPQIGVLLPCNVVVRDTGTAVAVEFMDPEAVLTLVEREGVAEIAAEVKQRLSRVKDALVSAG